jgi:two-component system response regulator YesN
MVSSLAAIERDNVAHFNKVFMFAGEPSDTGNIALPNMNAWMTVLDAGQKEKVLNEAAQFLNSSGSQKLNAKVLYQFQQDYLQMMYAFLGQKGIHAHQLLNDKSSMDLFEQAGRSVVNMLSWMEHITGKAVDYISQLQKSQSVTEKVKSFILLNIDKELTNEEIASQVFLNHVYLNRIFKRDTGKSLSEYIIGERFKIAQELLAKTEMPVSSIAANIGYSNFSHFSRLFRKHIGISPVDYRKKYNIDSKQV